MHRMTKKIKLLIKTPVILTSILLLTSCVAALPVLKTFAAAFGSQMISTASHNYSPKYGAQLEQLLLTLVPGRNNAQQQNQVQNQNQNQDWSNQNQNQNQDWSNQGQTSFADQSQNQQSYNNEDSQNTNYNVAQSVLPDAVSMNVDILVQRSNSSQPPQPIQDGETLFSVPGNPEAGDKIKVSFRPNCDCYVYIVGIDSTGYLAAIFPDKSNTNGNNPVKANRQYTFPEGTEWYGLDDFKGVENVYFIASKNRRLDLERIIKKMSRTPRNISKDNYQAVKVAAIPPTRGMVKINVANTTSMQSSFVQSSQGITHKFTPTTFSTSASNADLTITRWFNHQ